MSSWHYERLLRYGPRKLVESLVVISEEEHELVVVSDGAIAVEAITPVGRLWTLWGSACVPPVADTRYHRWEGEDP